MHRELSIPQLKLLLRYDSDTGELTWLARPEEMFATGNAFKTWNSRFANQPAFTSVSKDGYFQGCIHNQVFRAHRVVWALHYEVWPCDQIDHINGIRTDNRIINLRQVTNADNGRNQRKPRNNTSGHVGVYRSRKRGKWIAQIKVNAEVVVLGSFDKLEDAVAARKDAEQKYGFHPNHGRSS